MAFVIRGKKGNTEVFFNPKLPDQWTADSNAALEIQDGLAARDIANSLAKKLKKIRFITVWRK